MEKRVLALRKSLRGIDGLLVTNAANIRYLTGFTGSSGFCLITKKENVFVTDFRYKEQAQNEIKAEVTSRETVIWEIVIEKNRLETIKRLYKKLGLKTLGFEAGMSYDFYERLKSKGIALKPVKDIVEKIRETKDPSELSLVKEAVRRAEGAFRDVLPYIKAGVKERAIALRLEERIKARGSARLPFDIIVASGANSAMPHHRAGEKKLEPGDLVVIDFGGEAGGYFSDITRTLLVRGGKPSKNKEIYGIVLEANRAGLDAAKAGARIKEIDNRARDVIKKAGYGEFFGHSLGHGVGLEVHEGPRISGKAGGKKALEGMVFTIEPGIYLPGAGGVRIEDMVYVGKNKSALPLTTLPRGLKIVG